MLREKVKLKAENPSYMERAHVIKESYTNKYYIPIHACI